jgi:hypothetical protein
MSQITHLLAAAAHGDRQAAADLLPLVYDESNRRPAVGVRSGLAGRRPRRRVIGIILGFSGALPG